MDDLREKVINELVEHIESALSVDSDYVDRVRTDLLQTVVWLLKAQEPRVVTPSDFENNPDLDSLGYLNVYEEYKDGTRSGWNTISVNDVRSFTDIRRYWTSRPTDEQREAVKWNE